jgi:hypothetical protein
VPNRCKVVEKAFAGSHAAVPQAYNGVMGRTMERTSDAGTRLSGMDGTGVRNAVASRKCFPGSPHEGKYLRWGLNKGFLLSNDLSSCYDHRDL